MKICSIRIKGYQQFDDLYLDFTNPETGEPVDKVCFIGSNGTGKSTLLRFIKNIVLNITGGIIAYLPPAFALKLKVGINEYIYFENSQTSSRYYLLPDIEQTEDWFPTLIKATDGISDFNNETIKIKSYLIENEGVKEIDRLLRIKDNNNDLVIFSPPESHQNNYLAVAEVPDTSLNAALLLFNDFKSFHIVSDENISEFWRLLIFLIKKRENKREKFENLPDNLNKTKKQLIEEFDQQEPKILKELAALWNRILDKAGLEFDYESASNPIQLNDNLKAYIKLKNTGEKINYNQLSTGIRNFIFRIGHIYSLYFNREIKKGFLLVDEPENSLFPDFLYELIDIYQEIITDKNGERNTQSFFATHNPIIAAQFEPYERILLEWDDTGHVQAFKGKAPAGDDPNDLLRQDFKLDHLMGRKGQEMWQEYLNLKKQLRHTKNGKDKEDLVFKISKIGQLYNFEQ